MDFIRDQLRYSVRQLRQSRGYALAAITTLALGIGANAAVFSVVDAALLRPLPYPHADQIVRAYSSVKGALWTVSPPDFFDWKAQTKSFAALAAFNNESSTLTGYGDPQPLQSAAVTQGFFDAMGVQPAMGHPFSAAEETYGQTHFAIISDGLWRTLLGGRTDIVGQTLQLDGESFVVAGVMPPGFNYPGNTRLWTPLAFSDTALATQRGAHYLSVVGRLGPGVTIERATSELATVANRLALQYPNTSRNQSANTRSLRDALVGQTPRRALLILLGAVALVALIACANVANLLLARGAGRMHDMAIRTALGARPRDLMAMALSESVLLALIGGALGLAIAVAGTRALDSIRPDALRNLGATHVDLSVLAFTALLSLLTGVLFGIAPALQAARAANVQGAMQAGGRAGMIGRDGWRLRSGLVAAELALAVVLLAGAGLLIKSFARLEQVNPGFDPGGLLTFDLGLPDARYHTPEQSDLFYEQLVQRLSALPGVQSTAAISMLPLNDESYSITTNSVDGINFDPGHEPSTQIRLVTPEAFRALRIPLVSGRVFTNADRSGTPHVIVVNQAAANLLWHGLSPVGHQAIIGTRFGLGGERAGGEVIGVVNDIHDDALGTTPRPTIYVAHAQYPVSDMSIVMRAAAGSDPLSLVAGVRANMTQLDPRLPTFNLQSMEHIVDRSVAQPKFAMFLLATFALIAAVLAAVGIYGVMTYVVGQRTREIGVRMALGATGGTVVRETLRRAMIPASIGVVTGLAGALVLTRTMNQLLFEVTPSDPATLALVTVGLGMVAVGAAWIPARRASRVDPLIALRGE